MDKFSHWQYGNQLFLIWSGGEEALWSFEFFFAAGCQSHVILRMSLLRIINCLVSTLVKIWWKIKRFRGFEIMDIGYGISMVKFHTEEEAFIGDP